MKRYFSFLILFLVAAGLSSCLKDEAVLDPSGSKNIIEFYNVTAPASGVTAPYVLYVPTTLEVVPSASFEIAVSYSGAELSAPQDITVNLAVAGDAISAFNASQGSSYVQMSSANFDFPSSVTIKKGEKRAYATVTVKPDQLDQSVSNALALTISSASYGEISGNFRTVIYSLPVKSIWEGTYTYTVVNNFGGIDANDLNFTETGVKLSTVGPNRLYMQYPWRTYTGSMEYQFNADNTGIIAIQGISGTTQIPGSQIEVLEIDTDNLIFEVKWVGLGRGIIERFVRTGD